MPLMGTRRLPAEAVGGVLFFPTAHPSACVSAHSLHYSPTSFFKVRVKPRGLTREEGRGQTLGVNRLSQPVGGVRPGGFAVSGASYYEAEAA